jgi:hypothetical protein
METTWPLQDAKNRLSELLETVLKNGAQTITRHGKPIAVVVWYQRIERWATGRILPVDAAVMKTWAAFYAKHQRAGRKLPAMDSLIAATALQHQLTLVTRNTADFPDDVHVLNPWTV